MTDETLTQRQMASMGGKARALKLNKARKLAIAKRAASVRWLKRPRYVRKVDA